ncbi:MAG: aminoglycoside phosphotransferase family protein [Myxococcota bacterium]|jgi:aminoglycoside phosphotransferase (APT) family kinase protein|nr:aminoglycoside phosphotransferase family protein [Myxococcota bacterium]
MDVSVDGAIAVVKEHLRELGRSCEPSVLADRSNLVLALDSRSPDGALVTSGEPVALSASIARVAMATSASRVGLAWLAREVEVASFLAARGAPSTRPSLELPPGPHEREGYVISYWARETLVDAVSPESKGRALADVHAALRDFSDESAGTDRLPRLGAWEEARAMLPGLRTSAWLDAESRDRVARAWDRAEHVVASAEARTASWQAVHGDAHLGNVLATTRGALWTDWEDAFLGPIEWDLATLTSRHRLFGEEPTLPAVLAAYTGPHDAELVDELLEARSLQAIVWLHLFAERDRSLRARVQARVDRLRG